MSEKIRKLTVQEGHTGDKYIPVPTLVLKGKWLSELGYTPKTKVEVVPQEDGTLLIRPIFKPEEE